LLLHPLELVLHLERRVALIDARLLDGRELLLRPPLLAKRLARERLVLALERELGALLPLFDFGAKVVRLFAELLLGSDRRDDVLAPGLELVGHLLEVELEELPVVFGFVEQ